MRVPRKYLRVIETTHGYVSVVSALALPERWRDVFLANAPQLLKGAKAPDRKFRDFRNHVFHPPYGGAPEAAERAWRKMVDEFLKGNSRKGVFWAGVSSHYIADVTQPMHTDTSPEEERVHKVFEYAVFKAIKRGVIAPTPQEDLVKKYYRVGDVSEIVERLAYKSHRLYDEVVKLSMRLLEKGEVKRIEKHGKLLNIANEMLTHACSAVLASWMLGLERVREPPKVRKLLAAIMWWLTLPGRLLYSLIETYRYYTRFVRSALKEVIPSRIPYDIIVKRAFGREPPLECKPKLTLKDDVIRAPGIGRVTAEKLRTAGICTIADLLTAEPEEIARIVSYLTPEKVREVQGATRLMLRLPIRSETLAMELYRAGYRSVLAIASASPEDIVNAVKRVRLSVDEARHIVKCAQLMSGAEVRA